MTIEEKRALIERYRRGVDGLEASIAGIDKAAQDFVPPVEGAWPIRSQIAHMLDADILGWARIRRAVAQPGASVELWDQEAWAARLDYPRADIAATLGLERSLRGAIADFLESIVGEDWGALWIDHPEGGRLDLAALVSKYIDHVGFHLRLIERNLKAYRER